VGDETRKKAAKPDTFIHYEVEVISRLGLPIVFANLNQSRESQSNRIPAALGSPLYTISTSFQPKIIQYALDEFPVAFEKNERATGESKKTGPYYYKTTVYEKLGI
jgi:hypothetical protein